MNEERKHKHIEDIDIQKAAETTNGNVFDLIVYAAQHARNIHAKRNKIDAKENKINKYEYKPLNQALDDFQNKVIK